LVKVKKAVTFSAMVFIARIQLISQSRLERVTYRVTYLLKRMQVENVGSTNRSQKEY